MAIPQRVWDKVEITASCWNWLASTDAEGYGQLIENGKYFSAHRYMYENRVGPIPTGMVIDHLCRNRRCVNTAHLEVVTPRENTRRGAGTGGVLYQPKTECTHGHAYTEENTLWWGGKRVCRECAAKREAARPSRKRNRARR